MATVTQVAETTMRIEQGEFTLERPQTSKASPLRAWSAADELVLNHLLDIGDLGRVLIVNDEFGALTCGLAASDPVVWTDSALSRAAINANLSTNGLEVLPPERLVPGDQSPHGEFDTIIVRIPKTTALLDYQLAVVASISAADARVVGTGMVRHIHSSTVESFEQIVGPTTTSRATRKARLIHTAPTGVATATDLPRNEFTIESGIRVAELPGTFSAGHVDVGSALLLEVLAAEPQPPAGSLVADLGCGNGVLSAEMAMRWPAAQFLLLDVSDLAIAAAQRTWQLNELGDRIKAEAVDGFGATGSDSVNIVITNPPFHQGHALDADMTDRLMADMARVLSPDGVGYVVAQRHLHMHTRLHQWFTNVDVLSKHPSHVVIKVS